MLQCEHACRLVVTRDASQKTDFGARRSGRETGKEDEAGGRWTVVHGYEESCRGISYG